MSINKLKTPDSLESIVSLYDYKLPFSVAEYVCRIFQTNIVSNTPIRYKTLFGNFIEYKDHITYVFDKILDSEKKGYFFIKLTGVELNIPVGKDSEFMEKYSNTIFSSSADCGLEWFDEEDYRNDKINLDNSKYIGRCNLIF